MLFSDNFYMENTEKINMLHLVNEQLLSCIISKPVTYIYKYYIHKAWHVCQGLGLLFSMGQWLCQHHIFLKQRQHHKMNGFLGEKTLNCSNYYYSLTSLPDRHPSKMVSMKADLSPALKLNISACIWTTFFSPECLGKGSGIWDKVCGFGKIYFAVIKKCKKK